MPTNTVRLHRVLAAQPEKIYRAFARTPTTHCRIDPDW